MNHRHPWLEVAIGVCFGAIAFVALLAATGALTLNVEVIEGWFGGGSAAGLVAR